MHQLLIFAPIPLPPPIEALRAEFIAAGYAVAAPDLDGSYEQARAALEGAFSGRPPEILLMDLSVSPNCLPLRRLERLLRSVWGEGLPIPPRLALVCPGDLPKPDWLAATDDFLLPPYSREEALARVRLLLFRRRHVALGDTLNFADLILDLAGGLARDGDGCVLPLRPREFDLLRFLVTHRGKFFGRAQLLDMVWGVDFEGSERTVDIHIRRLRAKLPSSSAGLLDTRRGVGYGFRLPS